MGTRSSLMYDVSRFALAVVAPRYILVPAVGGGFELREADPAADEGMVTIMKSRSVGKSVIL